MKRVIIMWAHSRSLSTAFLRMMIERGDVLVLHEPLLAIAEEGGVLLPTPDGGSMMVRSASQLLSFLEKIGRIWPIFVKEVLDCRYDYLIDHPAEIAWMTHTFIVRDPRQAISSHYAMNPLVTCSEIGYERLYELFELAWSMTGRIPVVIRAEQLLCDPAKIVKAYCEAVGLPFLAHALTWRGEDRPEWQRTREWHIDAIRSSGFARIQKSYFDTIDNNPTLKSYYEYHYPFYQKMVRHALDF